MVERSDVVLAVIPVLALAGPVVASGARMLETTAGVGGAVTRLPLTPLGLVAALAVIFVAMFLLPEQRERRC
jgi:hypothetical protein